MGFTHTHTFTDCLEHKAEFERLRHVYHCNSARAACHLGDDGLLYVDYSGVIAQGEFTRLDHEVLPARRAAPAAVERMDRAITLPGQIIIDPKAWPAGTPPSVVIVRDDQFSASAEFCRLLALRGIFRHTFLLHQAKLALAWVVAFAEHSKLRYCTH